MVDKNIPVASFNRDTFPRRSGLGWLIRHETGRISHENDAGGIFLDYPPPFLLLSCQNA